MSRKHPEVVLGSGDLDDRPGVGLLEYLTVEDLIRRAEGDLAVVQAEDGIPAPRLNQVVGRDHDPASLGGKLRDQRLEPSGGGDSQAREGCTQPAQPRVL